MNTDKGQRTSATARTIQELLASIVAAQYCEPGAPRAIPSPVPQPGTHQEPPEENKKPS